jgi:hypothetical protein
MRSATGNSIMPSSGKISPHLGDLSIVIFAVPTHPGSVAHSGGL